MRNVFAAILTLVIATTASPARAEDAEGGAQVGYKKGFFIKDGVNALTIQGRVQARFTYEEPDGGHDENNFSIARARLTLKGNVFEKNLEYKLQTDFGKGGAVLKDFLVDYRLGGDGPWIRAGQWKRPFSRQQINSSGRLELVDRAITDKAFGSGRDIGVAIHNGYEKSPEFEWVVGVFNGTGDKPWFDGDVEVDPATGEGEVTRGKFTNVPKALHPAVVARVGYNANGIKGYSEADLEGGPLRFGVGASALANFDTDGGDDSNIRGELDFAVKAEGFSATGGIYFATAQDGEGFADQILAGDYRRFLRLLAQARLQVADRRRRADQRGQRKHWRFHDGPAGAHPAPIVLVTLVSAVSRSCHLHRAGFQHEQ